MSLSNSDIFTIRGYTHTADDIVNLWCRKDNNWYPILVKKLNFDYSKDYFPYFFQVIYVCIFLKDKNNLIYINNKSLFDTIIHQNNYSSQYKVFLLNIELFKDIGYNFWQLVIKKFILDLSRIILSSPSTTKCIVLWRGSNSEYLKKLANTSSKDLIHKGFVSCSFDIQSTKAFMNEDKSCCLIRVTIPTNTHCLFVPCVSVFHTEGEILLSNNAIFTALNPLYREIYIPDDETTTNEFNLLCNNKNKIKASFLQFKTYSNKDIT